MKRCHSFGLLYTIRMYIVKSLCDSNEYKKLLLSFIRPYFKDEINAANKHINDSEVNDTKKYVWTMWWQGEDALPEVLKICYNSHLKYIDSNKYQYTMITKDNYSDYVEVPEYITEKLNRGIISFTHFSDLLRVMLVRKYGGAWIDITLLMQAPLNPDIFNYTFYSFNQKGTSYIPCGFGQSITQCQWAGFFLCSSLPNSTLFCFLENCLIKYWKEFDYTIDYFLLNLIIRLGYLEVSSIQQAIDEIPQNNENLYGLQPLMNNPYKETIMSCLCSNTHFFKLTQKVNYKELEGKDKTLYNELKSRLL